MGFRSWFFDKTGFDLKSLRYTPKLDLSRFESLGDNCEFGCFLVKSGNHHSSFFRFVRVMDLSTMSQLILNHFHDVFLFDNLASWGENMVFDQQYKIAFHSAIHSHNENGNMIFNVQGEQLVEIYQNELAKITYLSSKFLSELKTHNKIYVIKTNQQQCLNQIDEIHNTLRSIGQCKILNVRETDDKKKLYTIEKQSDNFYIGYLDQFADYNNVPDLNFYAWYKLMANANKIMTV
ncbi:hypothetical protein RHO15_01420 [Utexia brackfieldae]|uniref:hypothetical protein n=1 Tax=Utexia brackfieldae TaxID=3074108 RepID=UPI00370D8255